MRGLALLSTDALNAVSLHLFAASHKPGPSRLPRWLPETHRNENLKSTRQFEQA